MLQEASKRRRPQELGTGEGVLPQGLGMEEVVLRPRDMLQQVTTLQAVPWGACVVGSAPQLQGALQELPQPYRVITL